MYLESFSKRLKDLMELNELSNRALSLRVKADRASIRLWLSERFFPRYDALIRLSEFFNVRTDSLLGLENVEKEVEELETVKNKFPKDVQKCFFERIAAYMETNHLTKYAFAKRLNIDQKAFTNWLTKGSMPETATIIRLASVMKITVDELLSRKV